jgi:ribosomal-protein-alanine N-acetyltransferase
MNQSFGEYVIRDWRRDDASAIAKYANNRKIWINMYDAFPYPYTIGDAEAFLSKAIQGGLRTFYAIASDTEAVGGIGLTLGQGVHRFTAELGYWLGEPFWSRGIMTEAARTIVDYAFGELDLHRVFAEVYSTNPASARVLEKAGFTCEGILRASVVKDGRVIDQMLYAKINDVLSGEKGGWRP